MTLASSVFLFSIKASCHLESTDDDDFEIASGMKKRYTPQLIDLSSLEVLLKKSSLLKPPEALLLFLPPSFFSCVPHLSSYRTFNANQISLEDGSGSSGNSAKPICQEAKEQSWFLHYDRCR